MSRLRTIALAAALAAAVILLWLKATGPSQPQAPGPAPTPAPSVATTGATSPGSAPTPEAPRPSATAGTDEHDEDLAPGQQAVAAADPQALTVAHAFAVAWAEPWADPQQWRATLAGYATRGLAEALAGTDPKMVPARRITGPATGAAHDVNLVDADVPADTGIIRLQLVRHDGRWLVASLDWIPGDLR